uniref:LARGE xylosyl- and glucuronyltransferase 1 n=1 Tax=Periophthalmus magnuspinnatus TaxID=409849 RepID=A0A3B4ACB0_9GOBI
MMGMCRGRRKVVAALALLFVPALAWIYLCGRSNSWSLSVRSLSPLEPLSSVAVGGVSERQALELRVRAVEEENRLLRRELSRTPKTPAQSEEGTGDSETQKAGHRGGANSSDCSQQPAVDKCEVTVVL